MAIVEDIYSNHYISWYMSFLNEKEKKEYAKHINDLLNSVKQKLELDKTIKLQVRPISTCEYYMTTQCFYKTNDVSTAGFAKNVTKSVNLIWILGIPIIIAFSIAVTFLIFIILNKLNIPTESIAPLLTPITSTFTGIIVLFFSNKASR